MKQLLNLKTFFVIALVAIVAAVVYSNYAGNQANEGVTIMSHVKGPENAVVVLTEYSDFQCPACAQFYPIVRELQEQYADQLAVEYKHFPLISIHPFAVPAARAAEAAAQQGKFWEMHDKLFDNQQIWSRAGNPRAFFSQYAEEIGLDVDQFNRQYGSSVLEDHIESQFGEARELGLTGTPSFLLNGQRLQFQTYEEFITQVESALGVSATATDEAPADVEPASAEPEVRFGF